ncbi:hypothetical protein [Paeniglutamicibacter gangotriensis]|uniref:hypothetical protein n=1 Tax=Paeniglutamicibacter gangotriensis TaxID=254787 RepID=UPI0013765442|nr:hypothetical protein [Paeniglutamicibacter gangotriensis]
MHALDPGRLPVDEAEVAADDPDDGRDGFCVGRSIIGGLVFWRQAYGQNGGEFLRG